MVERIITKSLTEALLPIMSASRLGFRDLRSAKRLGEAP